jgi:hypothetical protein
LAEAPRFQAIDETNRHDHAHLRPDDECYFLYEYTSGKDYTFSSTNSLISNLKKKPSLAGTFQYQYKLREIRKCGRLLGSAIDIQWLLGATLVPVPPSKALGHPEHDRRMSEVCQCVPAPFTVDVRELVVQQASTAAAHESAGSRVTVEELLALYVVNEALATPPPERIAIVDDVLTAGTHYRAMHTVLSTRFPGVQLVGMFIARRVFPNDRLDDFFPTFDDIFK